ncbi:MAG: OmpH family outer membrane protein [Saprospiraceae bacterium]|nr:OmpH family outer membrane protein [Saprospiraceae bacterium]
MKVNFKVVLLLAGFVSLQTTAVLAQKFGYTNSAAILVEMPATKSADAQLKTLQEQLTKELKDKETEFNAKVQEYLQAADTGTLTPKQMQDQEAALTAEQQNLQKLQNDAMVKIQNKRDQLYSPILEKVQLAIDAVGKEKGYDIIFDVAALNVILFANESEDVTALIKAKL